MTGTWVSVISEDWALRMVTPKKGDYTRVPLTPAARKVADSWDPAKDAAANEGCKAYGAPGLIRLPGRIRISWQDDSTLKLETDAVRRIAQDVAAGIRFQSVPQHQAVRHIKTLDRRRARPAGGARSREAQSIDRSHRRRMA